MQELCSEGGHRIQDLIMMKALSCLPMFRLMIMVNFTFEELPDGTYRINFEYPGVPMDTSSFVEFVLGEGGSEDTYSFSSNGY